MKTLAAAEGRVETKTYSSHYSI